MATETEVRLVQEIERLKRQVERLKVGEIPTGGFVPLTTALTSTAWDGDSFSTTGKTKIDLSAVFGAPAGIKAALFMVSIRDSGSAANDRWFLLSPNDTVIQGLSVTAHPVNDRWTRVTMVVPCDANGDVYYQLNASGSGTMDIYLEIWGYWL